MLIQISDVIKCIWLVLKFRAQRLDFCLSDSEVTSPLNINTPSEWNEFPKLPFSHRAVGGGCGDEFWYYLPELKLFEELI